MQHLGRGTPADIGDVQRTAPMHAPDAVVWLVSVSATPFALARWAPVWFVVAWTTVHSVAYWSYVLGRHTENSILWRAARMVSSVVVWGSVPVSAVIVGEYSPNEPVVLLVAFAFVSLRAIVPPNDRRLAWEVDGLLVGSIAAACSFAAGTQAFSLAALAGSAIYLLAERGQLMMHAQARADKEAVAKAMSDMKALAFTDQLTGLGNRRGAIEWLESHVSGPAAVLLFDIDDFKVINDRHGHQVGDVALREVARTITERLGAEWAVFRLGGDEFIAVSAGRSNLSTEQLEPIAVHTVSYDGTPISIEVRISGGTGYLQFPVTLDRAMESAAPALRMSKRDPQLGLVQASRAVSAEDPWNYSLRVLDALDAAQFTWWGQPIVELSSGKPIAVELLCRWVQVDGSVTFPADFLGVIAAFRHQRDLGKQNIGDVARWLEALEGAGFEDLVVHLNVPPSHVASGLVEDLATGLDKKQLRRLAVEVLESEILHVNQSVIDSLAVLRTSGVHLLIDDFGAGHSAFQYLTELSFDGVKLDRELVTQVDTHARRRAIMNGIAPVFDELGVVSVAEGVETAGEYEVARLAGVDHGQGWFIARPAPMKECIESLIDLRDNPLNGRVETDSAASQSQ